MRYLVLILISFILIGCKPPADDSAYEAGACAESSVAGAWNDGYTGAQGILEIYGDCTAYEYECEAEMALQSNGDGTITITTGESNQFYSKCMPRNSVATCNLDDSDPNRMVIDCGGSSIIYDR